MTDPLTISTIAGIGKSIIERIWPDPTAQAEAQLKLAELEQKGDLAELNAYVRQLEGQLKINLEEAKNPNLFVSGWRPAVGWTACVALFVTYVPKALIVTFVWTYQVIAMIKGAPDISTLELPEFPDLGVTDLLGLLGSMLGIGIMRSVDKFNKVDTKKHN